MGVQCFYEEFHRNARTVGDLRKAIEEIPDETPIECELCDGVELAFQRLEHEPKGTISVVSLNGWDSEEDEEDEEDD
jgi:hypothetical protein